jgi:predicted nucleic acid-binding protein
LTANRIIDCCSLINLHAGWGGLTEMKALGLSIYVAEAVLSEAQFVGEFQPDGSITKVPIDFARLRAAQLVDSVKPDSEAEVADYVEFSMELDDGEAQSLAIAKHRGFTLLTDDRKAMRIASLPEVGVTVLTTPEVLRQWSEIDALNLARTPEVLSRIQALARFSPRKDSPGAEWWQEQILRIVG